MPRKPRYDTEAKQRKAIRMLKADRAFPSAYMKDDTIVRIYSRSKGVLIATFDLAKFPGMRRPLKGVRKLQKDLKRVVR